MTSSASQPYSVDGRYIKKVGREITASEYLKEKIDAIPEVVDNVHDRSTDKALSANQGRLLQDQIDELKTPGKFLGNWNASTGLSEISLPNDPYVYGNGDYFVVSVVSQTTNYKPEGIMYTEGVASQTVETETIGIDDRYMFNGNEWILIPASQRQIAIDQALSSTSANPVENRVIKAKIDSIDAEIEDKANASSGATGEQPAGNPGDIYVDEDEDKIYIKGVDSWKDISEGGGGTSDYDQLTNKPAIDGNELDADSTAESLGLAKLEDVSTLDEILYKNPVSDIDVLSLESTVINTGTWAPDGSIGAMTSWNYYKIPNNKYLTLDVNLYSGTWSATYPYLVYFYSDDRIMNESTLISGAFPQTTAGSAITGTVTIPEGTKMIVINRRLTGGVSISAMASAEYGRLPDVEKQIDILNDPVFHGKVQDGLTVAVVGASISTKHGRDAYEMTITEEDVGVPLAAYLTYYDYYGLSGTTPVGFSLGGHTFTADEINKQVYFTPIAEDVGKSIGLALKCTCNDKIKVWWQYLEDLGTTVIPVCWSGSSISSHESSKTIRRCSWSWHESQIRKLGVRIPGSMQRKSPDIIIITRGINDMTHTPYALITDDYFNNWDWSYPTTDVITGGYGLLEGFSMWVQKVRETYPYAQIVVATCEGFKRVNCSKFPVNNGIYSVPQYNDTIRSAANFFGMQTIDWDRCGITFENMYPEYINDSATNPTHPNAKGHWLMGRQAIIDLENKMDLLHIAHRDSDSKLKFNITQTLSGVTSSNPATTVIVGTTYTTTLAPVNGTTVVVRQNGADITSSVYNSSTGVVTINPVDGDISIEATTSSVSYNITNTLTHVTNTNTNTTAGEYSIYSGELVSDVGYIKDSATITMGGTDITSTVYSDGFINIPSVTGDIVITASATQTIGGSYQIYNAKSGVPNGASPTQFTMNDLSKAIVKFKTTNDIAGNKSSIKSYYTGGIHTKIFCGIFPVGSGSNTHSEFGIGTSYLTSVRTQKNTEYIAVYDNINQATSRLTIYAGDDENLTTPLGTVTRNATVTHPFAVYGSYGNNSPQAYSNYIELIYTKLYDTNGDLIREYVPAIRTSDSEQGSYDKLTGEFVPLVVSE